MKHQNSIGVGEFKTHCLSLMSKINKNKQPIIITKRGKPIVKIVPYSLELQPLFGFMKGSIKEVGNIMDLSNEEWTADEENIF